MAHQMLEPEAIAALERDLDLAGLRTADVPGLAGFRLKWRWRFYRIADASFVMLIWNALAATAASNPAWKLALGMGALNIATLLFMESRARIISRQLNRPAAEQIARDMAGVWN